MVCANALHLSHHSLRQKHQQQPLPDYSLKNHNPSTFPFTSSINAALVLSFNPEVEIGVPIETVSKLLGHTKLSTTQIYARVVETKISEDINNLLIRFKTKKEQLKAESQPTFF